MAKQLNVNLAFTADTSKAKQQLKELQNALQDIAKMPGRAENLLDDKPIKEASKAALELQQHLAAALNPRTGNLDLSRLSTSLKNGGKTLDDYYNKLTAIGTEGNKAFFQLAKSIANAENPTARLNDKMSEFLTTLKNTARWQISSSILHGLTGAIQSAFYYAQDLNESLNNIRIVTGYSTDQMAEFAEKANDAAKALSATTTEYTDAALIYYQQGLSDEEVLDRTNATIKMANVTGQAAEDVSQQMTAIWNNFDNGSKSLEYYADVITALGAATASSSDEISEGLEKFASIAQTVGLSYEYATAALATVTAQTRQSADIVGNAFKTLFARLEGLQLGETLDDGTTLNKYSSALAAVGVNIKDTTGDLKDMDTILDELGEKWQTLGNNEKIALAQTVAGVRQYTQLVALMDNWSTFQQNVGIATGSEGTLNEQANIYAESWEAARDRVSAAAEGVYNTLLDDEFFINLANTFADIIEGVEGAAKAFGGLGGILRTIGGIFLTVYAKQWPATLDNLKANFMVLTGQANKLQQEIQKEAQAKIQEIQVNENLSRAEKVEAEAAEQLLKMKRQLLAASSSLTDEEKRAEEARIENVQAMYKETQKIAEQTDELEQQIEKEKELAIAKQRDEIRGTLGRYSDAATKVNYFEQKVAASSGEEKTGYEKALNRAKQEAVELEGELFIIEDRLQNLGLGDKFNVDDFIDNAGVENVSRIMKEIDSGSDSIGEYLNRLKSVTVQSQKLETLDSSIRSQAEAWEKTSPSIKEATTAFNSFIRQAKNLGVYNSEIENLDKQFQNAEKDGTLTVDSINEKMKLLVKELTDAGTGFNTTRANFEKETDAIVTKLLELGIPEETITKLQQDFNNLARAEDNLTQSTENNTVASERNIEINKKRSTSFSQLAGAMMGAWNAITSITNAFKTLADSSSSTADSVGALVGALMSVSFAASQLSPVISSFKTGMAAASAEGATGLAKIGSGLAGVTGLGATASLALGGVAAAVLVGVAAYKIYVKILQDTANKLKEQTDALRKEREALQEQANSINELVSKYKELKDELDENGNISTNLRNKIFDLCNEYEQYDLAVQSLTMSYEELNNALLELQKTQNENLLKKGEEEQETTKAFLQANIRANINSRQRDSFQTYGEDGRKIQTFDTGFENENVTKILNSFDIDTYGSGQVGLESLIEGASAHFNELVIALQKDGSKQAQALLKVLNDNQETFKTLAESVDATTSAQKDLIGNTQLNSVKDLASFSAAVEQMTVEAVGKKLFSGEDAKESAQQWAITWLASADESFSEYAQRYSLIDKIADATGNKPEEVSKSLEGYSDSVVAFVASHANSINILNKSLENYAKDAAEYLEIIQAGTSNVNVGLSLETYAEDGEFSDENIEALFAGDMSSFGYSQDQFSALTSGQQSIALLQYFTQNEELINEHKEAAITELEDYKNEVDTEIGKINDQLVGLSVDYSDVKSFAIASSTDSTLDSTEKVAEAIKKYIEGSEDLAENEKAYVQQLSNSNFELQKYIETKQEEIETNKEKEQQLKEDKILLEEELSSYEAAIQNIEDATSATVRLKAAQEGLSAVGEDIDNLQSAYSNLTDIVETYNTNGHFTIDTLQKLITMEPQYLAALEFEGNQLSINKDYLLTLMKARLEESKALVYEEGYTRLLTLAENDASKAADVEAIKQQFAGASAEKAGEQAFEAAKKWDALVKVMGAESSAESKAIIEDTEKRIKAIDDTINNLSIDMFSSGGSSSSAKEKEFKEYLEDVADRYYDINNAIAATNQTLKDNEYLQKRLASLQKHYSGNTLIQSLKIQNDLLKKNNEALAQQYSNYEQLYAIQSQELSELKGQIGGNWNGNVLENYSALFQNAVNQYNAVIDAYNAMSAAEQEKTGNQMVEDAKTAYDAYIDALDRYQDLYYNEMYDTENKLADVRQQQLENQLSIIENNLSGWETEITLSLDTTDFERTWNDFLEQIEQDFRKVYKDLALVSKNESTNFNTYLEDVSTYTKAIAEVEAEIDKMEASKDADGVVQLSDDMMFGSISEAQDKLRELRENLTSTGSSLASSYQQVWDNYLEGLDQAKDNFDDINDEFDYISNQLEYEKELIELIYGEEAYDMMNEYYEAQRKNIEAQISSTRTQAEFWQEQFNKAYQMNKEQHNVDLNDMSTWTEDMRKAYEEMISSQEELNDLVLEGIKAIKDEYLNNVSKTLSEMDKAIWGMSFDDLKNDWDYIQRRADEYLDDVEGAYQIQTLANKIDQSIAESSSLKAQQKLAQLREDEIEMLREKENLTQDDIDLAEARYQIALKEIALEEAQNNKTSMKLARDTSGNWTYQYVADTDDVQSKQQDLLDAYNNLYKTADDAYEHAMELAIDLYEEYKDKIKEVAEDTTLTEEEKLNKMKQLEEMYLTDIRAALDNAQTYEREAYAATAGVFEKVCDQDADNYKTLTDLQKQLVDAVKQNHLDDYEEIRAAVVADYDEIGQKAFDTFNETNQNSQTAAAEVIRQWSGENNDSVQSAFNTAFNEIIEYTQNYERELENLEEVSGQTITDPGGVVDDISKIGEEVDEVSNKTRELAEVIAPKLETLRSYVNNVADAWENVINQITEAIKVLNDYLGKQEAAAKASSTPSAPAVSAASSTTSTSVAISTSSSGNGPTGGSPSAAKDWSARNLSNGQTASNIASSESEAVKWVENNGGVRQSVDQAAKCVNYVPKTAMLRSVSVVSPTANGYWSELLTYSDGSTETRRTNKSLKENIGKIKGTFKTGGYTGSWDDHTGRLAVLHQKELVLNADDTENMLSAVNAVRDISKLNSSISQTIAGAIGQLVMNVAAAGGRYVNTTNTSESTSNVFNITAEFPNADDVQTIKEAILSLPNLVSQYVAER